MKDTIVCTYDKDEWDLSLKTVGRVTVYLESPYAPSEEYTTKQNVAYAKECMRDSIDKGEAPFLSHLFYTRVLDDTNVAERKIGMDCGFSWSQVCDKVVAYVDHGVSPGMIEGLLMATENGNPIEFRRLKKK